MNFTEDLQKLAADRAALENRQKALRAQAIKEVRQTASLFDLSADEIFAEDGRLKVEAKYRDAEGNTWTGRGRKPKWLRAAEAAGHALEDFRVEA